MRSFKDWFEHQLDKNMWFLDDKSDLIKLKRGKLESMLIYTCNCIIFSIAVVYLITIGMEAWGIAFGLQMLMWFILIIETGNEIRWINFVIYEKSKEEKI